MKVTRVFEPSKEVRSRTPNSMPACVIVELATYTSKTSQVREWVAMRMTGARQRGYLGDRIDRVDLARQREQLALLVGLVDIGKRRVPPVRWAPAQSATWPGASACP